MKQSQGFENPQYPNYVCKLQKAIYGLKHTPRAWFDTMSNAYILWVLFSQM